MLLKGSIKVWIIIKYKGFSETFSVYTVNKLTKSISLILHLSSVAERRKDKISVCFLVFNGSGI